MMSTPAKRLLPLFLIAISLQSCSLLQMGLDYYTRSEDHFSLDYGHHSPVYEHHNSTVGYDMQVSPTHIAVNIEKQPAWGPVGYDCAAFYYMPELNVYYDVNSSMFYYPSGGSWIPGQYLPYSYGGYNLYRTYKVVLNYSSPWQHNHNHLSQFRHYINDRSQMTISKSRDPKYSVSRYNERPWIDPNNRNHHGANRY